VNWFKRSQTWEELKMHGPKSRSPIANYDSINWGEGEFETLVQYIMNKFNYSKEQAEEYVKSMPEMYRRDYFIKNYGWSVPTKEAIETLKNFIGNDTVLSVGSGYGLWSKLLQEIGVNAIATTRISEKDRGHMPKHDHFFTDVENIEHLEAVEKYPDAGVLMMSWPPYDEPMAYETLRRFNGNKVIYIGEGMGGCTGCDRFHNRLYNEWKEVEDMHIEIPQWAGINDNVFLYVRS